MKKYILLSSFLVILSGCTQNLPVVIWIDDNFSEEEEYFILSAIQEWEDATEKNIFHYRGRHIDNEFNIEDLGDERHVIYKIIEPTEGSRFFVDMRIAETGDETHDLFGWGMHSDVLIYWYNLLDVYIEGVKEDRLDEAHEFLMWKLEDLVLHELGHFLGISHNDNVESIMCKNRQRENYPDPSLVSSYDVESFCRIYNCH